VARKRKCSSAPLASFFCAARTLSRSLSRVLHLLTQRDLVLCYPVLVVLGLVVLLVEE